MPRHWRLRLCPVRTMETFQRKRQQRRGVAIVESLDAVDGSVSEDETVVAVQYTEEHEHIIWLTCPHITRQTYAPLLNTRSSNNCLYGCPVCPNAELAHSVNIKAPYSTFESHISCGILVVRSLYHASGLQLLHSLRISAREIHQPCQRRTAQ